MMDEYKKEFIKKMMRDLCQKCEKTDQWSLSDALQTLGGACYLELSKPSRDDSDVLAYLTRFAKAVDDGWHVVKDTQESPLGK
jgi:hypothetical protein